jgi:hypothetical protein
MTTPKQTISDRLQLSIDDIARCARRHANDDPAIHDEICALLSKLGARKRTADVSYAANRKRAEANAAT